MPRECDPLPGSPRFWRQVTPTGFCWEWGGFLTEKGYGRFNGIKAHRYVYELLVGPIPEGMELDHVCSNRRCVNPDHLEPVTHAENVARSTKAISAARRRAAASITHCPHGHEYTVENTRISSRGWRVCRSCHRQASRKKVAA